MLDKGNEHIHRLTNNGSVYRIRFDMVSETMTWLHAEYETFRIHDNTDKYELKLGGFSHGNVGMHMCL